MGRTWGALRCYELDRDFFEEAKTTQVFVDCGKYKKKDTFVNVIL